MNIRSRAPLRLGFAGGGTDLIDFSKRFGGAVFNATISMFSYCTITPTDDGKIVFIAPDRKQRVTVDSVPKIELSEPLILHKGVYNRIVKDYNGGRPLSFKISTSSDAPAGSGLGTSSTMVVAILEAFNRWLGLRLNDYTKARLSYEIEREDIGLAGGKQDQYAAVFGGFNLMEFRQDGAVIVNPLRMEKQILNELECSMLLFYGGKSRDSAAIISQQIDNTKRNDEKSIKAMQSLKQIAYSMKDSLLTGDFATFAKILREGWEAKKKTSSVITNSELDGIVAYAMDNGADAVKVSGAGGGGFIMMLCNPVKRQELFDALSKKKGTVFPVKFSKCGVESWVVEG
jgi:D-glycero-alpha-D-manno-heptose-7-phosphate kinase